MRSKSKRNHFSQKAELNEYIGFVVSFFLLSIFSRVTYSLVYFFYSWIKGEQLKCAYSNFGWYIKMGRMEYTQYPVSILEPSSKKKKRIKKKTLIWFQISYFGINLVDFEMKVKIFDKRREKTDCRANGRELSTTQQVYVIILLTWFTSECACDFFFLFSLLG